MQTIHPAVQLSDDRVERLINGIASGIWHDGKLTLRRDELPAVIRGIASLTALASPVSTGIAGDIPAVEVITWEQVLLAKHPNYPLDRVPALLKSKCLEVEVGMLRNVIKAYREVAAVPAQPTQPQPIGLRWPNGHYADFDPSQPNQPPGFVYLYAQPQQVEGAAPKLTVWEGPMPESNGKSNFTAVLHREDIKGFDIFTDGYQFARSEYPDRVRYEADFMRWLIGERETKPELWEKCYDMDKHSGYVEPSTLSPEPAKVGGAGELVKEIHSAVLALRVDPAVTMPEKVAFQAGVHRAAAIVSGFAAKASGVQAATARTGQQLYESWAHQQGNRCTIPPWDKLTTSTQVHWNKQAIYGPTKDSK